MSDRKTALLFFQEDIDEAFQLWLVNHPEVQMKLPFMFRIRQVNPRMAQYDLVPTSPYHGHTKLEWREAVSVDQKDLEEAFSLLLGKRNLSVEGGFWMRIYSGRTLEIALIPHVNQQKFAE